MIERLNVCGGVNVISPCNGLDSRKLGKVEKFNKININPTVNHQNTNGFRPNTMGEVGKLDKINRYPTVNTQKPKVFKNNKFLKGKASCPSVKIRLLNVQGFDEIKYQDLEMRYLTDEVFLGKKKYKLLCLTETQLRVEKVKCNDNVFRHSVMRGFGGKRGGGLSVLGRSDSRVRLDLIPQIQGRDLLVMDGVLFGLEIRIILVYCDCSRAKNGPDFDSNRALEWQVTQLISTNNKRGLILLGDFNATLEF